MARLKKKNKNLSKKIAVNRIERLFEMAAQDYHSNPKRSDQYIALARKIGLRYVIRFPFEFKIKFCKNCGCYLVSGSNSRTRLKGTYIVITCLNCNSVKRYPYH